MELLTFIKMPPEQIFLVVITAVPSITELLIITHFHQIPAVEVQEAEVPHPEIQPPLRTQALLRTLIP